LEPGHQEDVPFPFVLICR